MSDGWDFASGLFGAEEAFSGASTAGLNLSDFSPTGGGGSGLWDFAGQIGGGLEKGWDWLTTGTGQGGAPTSESPLASFGRLLGLGATGLGVASGLSTQRQLAKQTQRIEQGQKTAQAAAAPAVEFGREQLEAGRAGKLPPPMEAAIAQWTQQAKADMRARLAHMGLGESTDIQHLDAQIDQMALAMKAQLLQSQEGVGLEALQTGVSAGTGVAGSAQQQQQSLAALIQSANQQLGRLGATA